MGSLAPLPGAVAAAWAALSLAPKPLLASVSLGSRPAPGNPQHSDTPPVRASGTQDPLLVCLSAPFPCGALAPAVWASAPPSRRPRRRDPELTSRWCR